MFQLIVAVISIALIAALAIASIFYGGDAFTKSSTKAQVTTLINQGQQIAGAAALFQTDHGTAATSIEDLDGTNFPLEAKYLADVPNGTKVTTGAWTISGSNAVIDFKDPTKSDDICEEVVNQGAGACVGSQGAYTNFSFAL